MKTVSIGLLVGFAAVLTSCETANPEGGAGSFQLSEADRARHAEREARRAEENAAAMAQPGGTVMYQHNETGLFGTRSSSGVIRSTGGVQSYQSIGGYPVQPGMIVPGYNYPGPSVNGGPGTYIDPVTGQTMYRP